MEAMEVFRVKSKGIKRVGYDHFEGILLIKFLNGSIYTYSNVPAYVYFNLLKSDCKELYFNSIKNNYKYKKIK